MRLKVGDSIYYYKGKDTYPGKVLQVGLVKVKITYNALNGDRVRWVRMTNVEHQEGQS